MENVKDRLVIYHFIDHCLVCRIGLVRSWIMEGIDDTTECPVCYETFDIERTIPRLLPCSHTVCEKCLSELLRPGRGVICPQCRKRHGAENRVNGFPQNKYIVKIMSNKAEFSGKFDVCRKHGRDLSLYCKDCKKEVCQLCLIQHHKSHDVVDEREEVKDKTKSIAEHVSNCKQNLWKVRKEVRRKCKESIEKLEKGRANQNRLFDSLIDRVASCMEDEEEKMNDQEKTVMDFDKKFHTISSSSLKKRKNQIETLNDLEKNSGALFNEKWSCKYYEFEDSDLEKDMEHIYCRLVSKRLSPFMDEGVICTTFLTKCMKKFLLQKIYLHQSSAQIFI